MMYLTLSTEHKFHTKSSSDSVRVLLESIIAPGGWRVCRVVNQVLDIGPYLPYPKTVTS